MSCLPPFRPRDATAVIGGRGDGATYAVAFAIGSEGRVGHAPRAARARGEVFALADLRSDVLAPRRMLETGFVVLTRRQFERFAATGLDLTLEGRRRPVPLSVPATAFAEALRRADALA